jgi:polysaccharide deacetylase family protein (PEP-CTERM system associated)
VIAHALTIDLEDWHQINRRAVTGEPGPLDRGLAAATHRILDRLDEAGARATFFVVGMVAEQAPALVRAIAARGHEIASHSHSHRLLAELPRRELELDLRRGKRVLEDLIGAPVLGFRAPCFVLGARGDAALASLARLGFRYDSSVVAARAPWTIATADGAIVEFPVAQMRIAGLRMPLGGGQLRVLPKALVRRAVARLERDGTPATLYVHPYEFQRGPLYVRGLGARNLRFARALLLHNLATWRVEASTVALLRTFRFGPLRDRLPAAEVARRDDGDPAAAP